MDWRNESIWELRNLEAKRASIKDLREQIRGFSQNMTAIRSATSDGTPVSGGGNGREDMLLNAIMERDALEATLAITTMQVDMVDRALADLSQTDRDILDLCYIHEKQGNLNLLCERLMCEIATVYRRRNTALKRYTIRRRGLMEV